MLEKLTDDQVAVLTELTIHHGMYRHIIGSPRYNIYCKIADELLDEMRTNRRCERWIKPLMEEYTMAQIKCVKEYEDG